MSDWIRHLDRLLRGEATSLPELRRGRLDIPVLGLSFVITALGAIYGACMGLFALTPTGSRDAMQLPASMIKVPALFFLTLLVTFPSLYVFNALVGSRLNFTSLLRLLIGSMAVMLAVLASLGPIVAFFSISTTSYAFMKLLNVIVFGLSGFLGLAFLLQTLHRMTVAGGLIAPAPAQAPLPPSPPTGSPVDPTSSTDVSEVAAAPEAGITDPGGPRHTAPSAFDDLGALDRLEGHVLGPHVRTVFRIWLVVFGLVGAQMAWVLRPFIGQPDAPFEWFRRRESNFFEALWELIKGFFTS
jgi:hypothetical protein